jgi:hypothetical protein
VAALSASKQQLRKQLQRMQASDTQLTQQLSDTQQVVAKEFATLRRHMQLVSCCSASRLEACASCAQRVQVANSLAYDQKYIVKERPVVSIIIPQFKAYLLVARHTNRHMYRHMICNPHIWHSYCCCCAAQASTRSAQASRSNRTAVTARVSALGERVEQLHEQLVLLKGTTALAGGNKRTSKAVKKQHAAQPPTQPALGRRSSAVSAATVPRQRQPSALRLQQQQQQQREQQEYDALAEALLSTESSGASAFASLAVHDMPGAAAAAASTTATAAEAAAAIRCGKEDELPEDSNTADAEGPPSQVQVRPSSGCLFAHALQ